MANAAALPVSLLEQLGVNLLQQAADQGLGAGVLTISADDSGLDLGLQLTGGQTINIDGLTIGSQGLAGRLFVDGLDTAPLEATLFDGFAIALTAFDVTLAQGGLATSHVGGQLTIPFFTDGSGYPKTVDVELGFKSDGSFSITLAASESVNGTTPDGLVQLIYDIGSAVTVEIDVASLEIDHASDGTWRIVLSGELLVTTADLSWPSFELRGLGIDSKGHISIDGGWINLPSQTALDFYGFHVALQQLGFGSDGSGRWIGFSGDIYLVEGLQLGGSVRGLRINLETGALSFDGVGIAFEIPDVLTIDGEVDHIHVDANSPTELINAGLPGALFNYIDPPGQTAPPGGKKVDLFTGQVKLVVEPAGDLEVDANFIVGHFGGQSVFFLDLDAELPVGIPIFLDVSLYGLQGLVASGLEPHPEPKNTWWEWYKYKMDTTTGVPDLSQTKYSATDPDKWMLFPKPGAFAIGAGATIGTSVDDGFTVSAAVMLVVLLPGPVISFIGKANILSKRISGADQDANFEAMATYDGTAATFDLTIDAQYQIPVVLDIEGTAELYVNAPQDQWFFALGKPPHDKRLKARIFDLFESDAYFVVGDSGLVTGTWTGYQGSWSFGPLSVSLDAYLATLAAIQWSPLQIGGGIELHGDVHLSAFGIGVGLTADALLEGCAPNPFWVHGEISVELDLPWPLPNLSATVSLTWGGDDGSVPPAPLALSHVDVTLSDHADRNDKAASDHYVLLAHRPNGPWPDASVQYDDPTAPGILNMTPAAQAAWHARVDGIAVSDIKPGLVPDNTSLSQLAPVVPQDAHFTLSFAHPTYDLAQFPDSTGNLPPDYVTVSLPPLAGKDDMSNIDPNPPAPQWAYRHSLIEVALFAWQGAAWNQVCSYPSAPPQAPPLNVTQLDGVWLAPPPSKTDPSQVQTQLKVFPWRLVPGQSWTAQWSGASPAQSYPAQFTDQGLQFSLVGPVSAKIGTPGFDGILPGLEFANTAPPNQFTLTIQFPFEVQLALITAVDFAIEGEFTLRNPPSWLGDGTAITPASQSQDSVSGVWTQYFDDSTPTISALSIMPQGTLLIYALGYASPNVPMAILPYARTLYAIKVVTKIEAGRTSGGGAPAYQTVADGNPIVEFAYFQTAAGPGTGIVGQPQLPAALPAPEASAPFPQLSVNCAIQQQPASAFPLAGSLEDLQTYTQWSRPQDGAAAAYYGYDVNVEFDETYVNALYAVFASGSAANALHFRCFERNQVHTLLDPVAIHVPSMPLQGALVAGAINAPLPRPIAGAPFTPVRLPSPVAQQVVVAKMQGAPSAAPPLGLLDQLAQRAAQANNIDVTPDSQPLFLQGVSAGQLLEQYGLLGRKAGLNVLQLDPGVAAAIRHQLLEERDAAAALALWFKPLAASTRYTLDVVAGPFYEREEQRRAASLTAIYAATDATGVLAALKAYVAYEDSLTTLKRVQFTTSRYPTFTAQMANLVNQLAGTPGVTPIRHYVAAVDPVAWLGNGANSDINRTNARTSYLAARAALAAVVANFDPLADDRQPNGSPAQFGTATLVQDRAASGAAWQTFAQATSASFDGLIAALGRPDLASGRKPVAVADTELTLFTDQTASFVNALLIESPEPLRWRRTWQSIDLTPGFGGRGLSGSDVLWNADGTRGLIVVEGQARGSYQFNVTFQGNIGAEAPCITQNGNAVAERVSLGSLSLGPVRRFVGPPVNPPAAATSPPARTRGQSAGKAKKGRPRSRKGR